MNSSQVTVEIYDGYRIVKKEEICHLSSASDRLCGKGQSRYTQALLEEDAVRLVRHVFVCPCCGKEIPAYAHFIKKKSCPAVRKTKQEISDWIGMQLSFASERGKILYLQHPLEGDRSIQCPHCGTHSSQAKKVMRVQIVDQESCVIISRQISELVEVAEIPWVSNLSLKGSLPFTERLVYNFETGGVIAEILNAEGEVCSCSEVDEWELSEQGAFFDQLFQENRLARRYVRRFFQKHWTVPIPFSANEFSLAIQREMVRFQNYPRDFYDTIPYRDGSMQIDESFSPRIYGLRTAERAIEMLPMYHLPAIKSIRRCICNHSGLLFYLEECGVLYQILGDVNLFCDLLGTNDIFYFISQLHQYPGIRLFLENFAEATSAKELYRCIREYPVYMILLGIDYGVMSSSARLSEQKNWRKLRKMASEGCFRDRRTCFSLPMKTLPEKIKSQKVNGFFFRWLRTTAECKIAGQSLKNCLQRWDYCDNPVVAIYHSNRLVAAAEVEGNKVIQALRYQNGEIDVFSELYDALKEWCAINKLTLELWNDEMPF